MEHLGADVQDEARRDHVGVVCAAANTAFAAHRTVVTCGALLLDEASVLSRPQPCGILKCNVFPAVALRTIIMYQDLLNCNHNVTWNTSRVWII